MTTSDDGTTPRRTFSPTMDRAFRLVSAAHVALYRATGGRFGGRMRGNPVLLLSTVGRKTGRRRTTPLLYLPDSGNLVIVASKGGAPKHPAWWLNLRAKPRTEVQVGPQTLEVVAEETGREDKRRLWEKLVAAYPDYAEYQRRTEREIPVVVLKPLPGEG